MTEPSQQPAERIGLIVTNLTKLGGLIVALNEALFEQAIRSEVIAIAALMMAGAQAFETFVIAFFGAKK